MMKFSKPIRIGQYELRGVDDWCVFARDQNGWCFWNTECDRAWNTVAANTGHADAGCGGDSVEEVAAVGIMMAERGEAPQRVPDDCVDDTEGAFGDEFPAQALHADLPKYIARARYIIWNCEYALRRKLRNGERRDLLCDNTNWTRGTIVAVVDSLRAAQ